MRKFHLILWAILLAVVLSGCGAGGGGLFNSRAGQAAGIDAAAKPLDTAAIQTQTLGPAPEGSAPATGRVIGAAPPATATATSITPAQSTAAIAAPTSPQTAAEIGAAAAAALQAGATAATAAVPQSPEEAACVQDGGRWGKAGDTGAMACFQPMKDSGKTCSKESDCSSQCLARSRSCAPFWPMFGCTDIIQNDGAVVQLCLN
jgi:hypothetical protein